MQLDSKLISVPRWLYDLKQEMGIPNSHLLDLKALSNHLSTDDITSYLAVNLLPNKIQQIDDINLPKDLNLKPYFSSFSPLNLMANTQGYYPDGLSKSELKSLEDLNINALAYLENLDMTTFYQDITTKDDYSLYLGLMVQKPHETKEILSNNYVVDVFYIEEKVFGITLVPNTSVTKKSSLISAENVLEFLSRYYKYEDLCKSDIFHLWYNLIYANS